MDIPRGRRIGMEAESRFFEALAERTEQTPPWLLRIGRANPSFDRKGVDAFGYVEKSTGKRHRIPIQIKATSFGFVRYRKERPRYWFHGVVVVVIGKRTPDEIRTETYASLAIARDFDYVKFFEELSRSGPRGPIFK